MDNENFAFCTDCGSTDDGGSCDTCGRPLCHECRIRYTDGLEADCEQCMATKEEDEDSYDS